jgi:transcriptional regulator with XRE-family HTH domain
MLDTKEILRRLRVLREEKCLRQEYLARRLGIDRTTYARKEKGSIPLTTEEWLKLARAMDEEMEYFFTSSVSDIEARERLLLKLYRSLSLSEQRDLLATMHLILKGIGRKRVQDTLNRLLKPYMAAPSRREPSQRFRR